MQPVAIGLPEIREASARGDEHDRTAPDRKRAGRQRHGEAERRRPVAMGRRDHLMKGAAGQAGAGEVAIDVANTERKMRRRRAGSRAFQSRDDLSKSVDMLRSLHKNPATNAVQRG